MDTLQLPKAGHARRRYTPEFKAQLVAACQHPGVSVAAIALANQINPNQVRRWIREWKCTQVQPAEMDVACPAVASTQPITPRPGLVPVEVTAALSQPDRSSESNANCHTLPRVPPLLAESIQVEVRQGEMLLKVAWPAAQAETCARWLRGVLP